MTSIVHHQIEQNIDSTCKGNFETSYIEALEKVSNMFVCLIAIRTFYSMVIQVILFIKFN